MADFFEDIGYSKTLSSETSKLSDLVLNLRKQKMQEKEMGMAAQKFDLEKQNITSEIQARNVTTELNRQKLQDVMKQEKYLNTKTSLDDALKGVSPAARNLQINKLKELGLLENVPGTEDMQISNRNAAQFRDFVKDNPVFQKDVHTAIYNDAKAAEQHIQGVLAKAQENKLKPEVVQQLQASLKLASDHRKAALGYINLTDEQINKIQADVAQKQAESQVLPKEPFGKDFEQAKASIKELKDIPSDQLTSEQVDKINAKQEESKKRIAKAGASGRIEAEIEKTQLGPEAVDAAATSYNMTGKMPSVGMGVGGVLQRKQILDRAAKMLKEEGLSNADAVIKQIKTKTTQTALNQLDKLRQYTNTFEERTNLLFDTLVGMRQKIADSGIRSVNTLINIAEGKIEGTPDQRELASQVYEAMVDYGKVVTGQFSIAGMSDSARKETQQLLSSADREDTFARLVGPDGRFRKNMTLTKKSYDDTYDAALVKLGGTPAKGTIAAPGMSTTTGGSYSSLWR